MKNFDMHFHSTMSDGENTPDEILNKANDLGLELITLTDHDRISDDSFIKKAKEYKIESKSSVEISARNYETSKSSHLTCYANKFSGDIYSIIRNTIDQKIEMIKVQIQKLKDQGFIVDINDFYEYNKKLGKNVEVLNKVNIADFIYQNPENIKLVTNKAGKNISMIEFYREFLKENGEYHENYSVKINNYEPSIEVVGKLSQENNAVLSIAHPNLTFRKEGINYFEKSLSDYVDKGINAIEINNMASKEWIETIYKLKKKFNLILTAGSDNHSIGKTDDVHGDFGNINHLLTEEHKIIIIKEYLDFLK